MMAAESAQYNSSLRRQEEQLVGRALRFAGESPDSLEFATDDQMQKMQETYDRHVSDRLGPIQAVALPIAHSPEHVGAHAAVVSRDAKMNEALMPANMMGRASLNHIPYDSRLSADMIRRQLTPALKQRMHELEFNAAQQQSETDAKTGQIRQNWPTRFPPGSEFRIGTADVRAKHADGSSYTRPGYMLYLKTALPQHIDAAIRTLGSESETVGDVIDSPLVRDAQDYATRNHQRVLHEMGQVIRDAVGADHAVFVTTDDTKAEIGPHDMYPKMASPTGPSMSLNEMRPVDRVGVALYHNAATDVRGAGNVLAGDYHQPLLLVAHKSSASAHPRSQIDNTPRHNSVYNAYPATPRPFTRDEAARMQQTILGNRAMLERVQDSLSPMYTPSAHEASVHAHPNEIRTPAYVIDEDTVARHANFHPLSSAHERMLKTPQFQQALGTGADVIVIEPVTTVANLGAAP